MIVNSHMSTTCIHGNKSGGSLYNTKQWCKVKFQSEQFEPQSAEDVKKFGARHQCMLSDNDCLQIFSYVKEDRRKRDFMQQMQCKLRMRSTNFINLKKLMKIAPSMRSTLTTNTGSRVKRSSLLPSVWHTFNTSLYCLTFTHSASSIRGAYIFLSLSLTPHLIPKLHHLLAST